MKNVLVVEDNTEIREEIRDILIMENFNVYEASNGFAGLEIIKHTLPDLIISDISMPHLDGYAFLKELKKHGKTDRIPFIFLTAKADLADIRHGMNMGVDDYLTKPLSPGDLIIAVRNKLELRSKIENRLNEFKLQIAQYLPHELFTPLNGILGLSEYLKEDLVISKEEINTIADSINSCGQRLYRLIENYLIYSSLVVEAKSIQVNYNANDIMILKTQDIINTVALNIAAERIDDLLLITNDVTLKFSKYLYVKILEELFNNALKFSFSGTKILVSSMITGDKYVLQVVNYGIGITNEQIDEIGAFIQFDRKKNEQQGIGLGLEIVRLITELNDGEIIINSKPEEYFKVNIQFPIS
jgi:two-component system, sensor histidine kinase and response regulator